MVLHGKRCANYELEGDVKFLVKIVTGSVQLPTTFETKEKHASSYFIELQTAHQLSRIQST